MTDVRTENETEKYTRYGKKQKNKEEADEKKKAGKNKQRRKELLQLGLIIFNFEIG